MHQKQINMNRISRKSTMEVEFDSFCFMMCDGFIIQIANRRRPKCYM